MTLWHRLKLGHWPASAHLHRRPGCAGRWAVGALSLQAILTARASASSDTPPWSNVPWYHLNIALLALAIALWVILYLRRRWIHSREALAQEASRFRTLTETATVGIFQSDAEGAIIYANPRLCEILEMPAGRVLGWGWKTRLHPGNASWVEETYTRSVKSRQGHSHETVLRMTDGSSKHVQVTYSPVSSPAGRFLGLIGTITDLTAIRTAEEQRRKGLELFQAVVEAAPQPLISLDLDGRVTQFNRAAETVFGTSRQQVLGTISVHAAGWILGSSEVAATLRDGHAVHGIPLSHTTESGRKLELTVSAAPLHGPDGEVTGVVAMIVDETDRRQAERAAAESAESLRLSQRLACLGSWQVRFEEGEAPDSARQEIHWSAELLNILGLPPAAALARWNGIIDFVHPEDRRGLEAALDRARIHGGTFEMQCRVIRADGREIAARISVLSEIDRADYSVCLTGALQDITQAKLLEEQLMQSQKLEGLGRLAGGVAHDFNNLLTVINGYAGLTATQLSADHAAARYIPLIQDAVDRAGSLVARLLAFSRKQVSKPRTIDLNAIALGSEEILSRLIGEDINLVMRVSPEPLWIRADPGHIQQVLMNLAVNARDAMPKGGVLTISTNHRTEASGGGQAVLTVADCGEGMDSETISHIFEPFFTTKEQGRGTGLGLATVHGIVHQSGGTIQVRSRLGEGARFEISLPLCPAPEEHDQVAGGQAPRSTGPATILLVEDERGVREIVSIQLRRLGYQVLEAEGGPEALEICQTFHGPIHLLLSDVVMPVVSGFELAGEVSKLRPATRVLFVTGYSRGEIQDRLQDGRESRILPKPFTLDQLSRAVAEALAS
ncbi:MAG: PAS domain S-box protein [Acidobacteria bacterium]|nr:PAS domain S-box protein [Acidobacteriota bacterium]